MFKKKTTYTIGRLYYQMTVLLLLIIFNYIEEMFNYIYIYITKILIKKKKHINQGKRNVKCNKKLPPPRLKLDAKQHFL
jgi:hypothetical protein